MAVDIWRPEVEKALARVPEEDGHSQFWYERVIEMLDCLDRRSQALGSRVAEDVQGGKKATPS